MMTIVFTRDQTWLSRLIRLVTRSRVSHCGFGLTWAGVPVVLHAYIGGVAVVPRARFLKDNTVVEEVSAPAEAEGNLARAVEALDLPYDYLGLLGHLPVVFGRWLRRRVRNPFRSPDRLVCSELVVRVCPQAFADLDPEDATPEDVLSACQRLHSPRQDA